MHLIKLKITPQPSSPDTLFEYVNNYLELLGTNNQVTNGEFQFETMENGVMVNLYCPEKDAYKDKNSTEYAIAAKNRLLTELKLDLTFEWIGLDPELGKTYIPKRSSFYILQGFQSFFWSAVRCGDTLDQIPLYKIPYTSNHRNHDDIKFWGYHYRSIYDLWFTSYNDHWTLNQLQNHKSPLNQQGISCSRQMEAVTLVPTYYFLWNNRAWGQKKDKARKCPVCGKDWLIENTTFNNFYAFKCDDCRLVSELSSNC